MFENINALSLKFLISKDTKTVTLLTLRISGKTNFMVKDPSVMRRQPLRCLGDIDKFSGKLVKLGIQFGTKVRFK